MSFRIPSYVLESMATALGSARPPMLGARLSCKIPAWINIVTLSRATEMDVTMIGLQNAGKTSLLRVLAVGLHYFQQRINLIDVAPGR